MEDKPMESKNLFSRQNFVLGKDLQNKITDMKVLIIGMRGMGFEIAKNLVLMGVKVYVYDNSPATINDLSSNYFVKLEDIGGKRSVPSVKGLQSLNKFIKVELVENFNEEFIFKNQINCIYITDIILEKNTQFIYELNIISRKNKIPFIIALNLGITGIIFSDFGEDFEIFNKSGDDASKWSITNIERSNPCLIKYEKTNTPLLDKMNITIKNVKGSVELNELGSVTVKRVEKNGVKIDFDGTKLSPYLGDGIIEEIHHKSLKINYRSLRDNLNNYNLNNSPIYDYKYRHSRNKFILVLFESLLNYVDKTNKFPSKHDDNDYVEFFHIFKNISQSKSDLEQENFKKFNSSMIKNFCFYSSCNISPICSFIGGIAAQEAIKIFGKFTPINQFFIYDINDYIPDEGTVERKLIGTECDDQIAMFGNEIQDKLNNLNVFLVGAGALGCEYLKTLGLMGVSTGHGLITCTDADSISISNLSRQFLFSENDIGKLKSEVACLKVKQNLPNVKLNYMDQELGPQNYGIFNSTFFHKQDVLLSAVDNIEARKFLDIMSTDYDIPYMESGTLGLKCNTDIYLPYITDCYRNAMPSNIQKEEYPACTIKSFPYKIEHCIEWSLSLFKNYFVDMIEYFNNFMIEGKINEDGDLEEETLKKLHILKAYVIINETRDILNVLKFVISELNKLYDEELKFLQNYRSKEDIQYWSHKRRYPIIYEFKNHKNMYQEISYSFTLKLAKIFKIKFSYETFQKLFFEFEDEMRSNNFDKNLIFIEISNININKINISSLKALDYDKDLDNDLNFIHNTSYLRCMNYSISTVDIEETRKISGKIIPAVITSTAVVVGFNCLELFRVINHDRINTTAKNFKKINCDLRNGSCLFCSLNQPVKNNLGFSVWDKRIIKNEKLTLKSLLKLFETEYANLSLTAIYYNNENFVIYREYLHEDYEEEMEMTVEKIIHDNYKLEDASIIRLRMIAEYQEGNKIIPASIYIRYNPILNNIND